MGAATAAACTDGPWDVCGSDTETETEEDRLRPSCARRKAVVGQAPPSVAGDMDGSTAGVVTLAATASATTTASATGGVVRTSAAHSAPLGQAADGSLGSPSDKYSPPPPPRSSSHGRTDSVVGSLGADGDEAFNSLKREFELEDQAVKPDTWQSRASTSAAASAAATDVLPREAFCSRAGGEAAGVVDKSVDGEGTPSHAPPSGDGGSRRGDGSGGGSEAGVDLVCPLCHEVVATPQQVVQEMQQ